GRQAEALQAYQAARRALVDELGIEPSGHLQELERAILRQDSALRPLGPSTAPAHFEDVVDALLDRRLVPVLGACLAAGCDGLAPVDYLSGRFDCPARERRDLAWVAQYVAVTRGTGRLHDELHRLFDADHEPGPAHRLLARVPSFLRER